MGVTPDDDPVLRRRSQLARLADVGQKVGYGLFAAAVRDHVISRPRVMTWMRRTFAGAFAALGARLAFADR